MYVYINWPWYKRLCMEGRTAEEICVGSRHRRWTKFYASAVLAGLAVFLLRAPLKCYFYYHHPSLGLVLFSRLGCPLLTTRTTLTNRTAYTSVLLYGESNAEFKGDDTLLIWLSLVGFATSSPHRRLVQCCYQVRWRLNIAVYGGELSSKFFLQ